MNEQNAENEKYLQNGQAVYVIQKLDKGYLVEAVYEYDGEFPNYQTDPFIAPVVFDKAPTEKYDKQIDELTATIKSLQESRNTLSALFKSEEKTRDDKLEKFQKINQLKLLEDYIDGKITHYIEFGYGAPEITEFTKKQTDSYVDNCGLKLLTLFGRTDGDLQWKLNTYSDGSGSYRDVIACTSYEQVIEECQKWLDGLEFAVDPHVPGAVPRKRASKLIVNFAKKYDLKLPDGYIEKVKSDQTENLERLIKENAESAKKLKKELSETRQS